MENKIILRNGVLLIVCEGELDLKAAQQYRIAIDSKLEETEAKYLVFDLTEVTFIDSSGLGMILGRYRKVSCMGGRAALCGIRPKLSRMLEVSGLKTLMPVYQTRQEAIEGV